MINSLKGLNKIQKVMVSSFLVNLLLVIIKIVIGIIGLSHALIIDGVHSLSDLITDIVAIVGGYFSYKPADEKHPFGHGKIEYITSFIIGLIIMLIGFVIIYQMIGAKTVKPHTIVVMVSFLTIVVKLLLSKYLIKKGQEYNNNILVASGKESAADVYSSLVVLFSVIIIQFAKYNPYLIYADKIASIIIGIFIIKVGFNIVKENISMTVGEQIIDDNYLKEINKIIMLDNNLMEVSSLSILKYGPYFKLVGEVGMISTISLKDAHQIIDKIEDNLKLFDKRIQYVTIHMYPVEKKI